MTTYTDRVEELKKILAPCKTPQEIHHKIIALGRKLAPMPTSYLTDAHLVEGCQSRLYLHTSIKEGKTAFLVASDALISAGLAALLLFVYNDLPPKEVLENKPLFLQELGILASLSPSRTNGIANLYLKMIKDIIKN